MMQEQACVSDGSVLEEKLKENLAILLSGLRSQVLEAAIFWCRENCIEKITDIQQLESDFVNGLPLEPGEEDLLRQKFNASGRLSVIQRPPRVKEGTLSTSCARAPLRGSVCGCQQLVNHRVRGCPLDLPSGTRSNARRAHRSDSPNRPVCSYWSCHYSASGELWQDQGQLLVMSLFRLR
jgi:hypothetical protein